MTLFNSLAIILFGVIIYIQIVTLIYDLRWSWDIFLIGVFLCSIILLIDYLLIKYVADRFDVFVWQVVILGAIWGYVALMSL